MLRLGEFSFFILSSRRSDNSEEKEEDLVIRSKDIKCTLPFVRSIEAN
jgi:hypothetical protein